MDLGDDHPGLVLSKEIRQVVDKLRPHLRNSNDSYKFKGTLGKLNLLECNLRYLRPDSLQRVKPHIEEAASAWLHELKMATRDAEDFLDDMESEVNTSGSSTSDVMTWLCSDNTNLIRMAYIIGKLANVCVEGESIVDAPRLNANSPQDEKNDIISSSHGAMSSSKDKSLLHDNFLIGRDEEIAMLRDMVLKNAQYVPVTLQNIDLSMEVREAVEVAKETQEAEEVDHYDREMSSKVEYTLVAHDNISTNLRNPTVIPIFGIGGVGKTALAQFIFEDASVQDHFGYRSAWVYVKDRISEEEMIKQIIFSFGPECVTDRISGELMIKLTNLKDAHSVLQRIIEGKRFFLVLDDVWNEMDMIWDSLRIALSKGAPGSVILVTTQQFGVATSIGTTGPIILNPLQYEDSWTLLKHYAFADPCSSQFMQSLEPIGREIADRLHGIPLVLKVIGASLRTNIEEYYWKKLLKGWRWNGPDDNLGMNIIISSLESCYCELPGYMRQCFIYCSIFPRNYLFERYKLVQMWIANGFIQLSNTTAARRLDDLAGQWFDELVNRAFLQPSACKTGYIMHDLVRDFSSALYSNEYHGVFDNKSRNISQIRHLSIEMDDLSMQQANSFRQLRTLMLSGDSSEFFSGIEAHHLDTILKSSVRLHILDFSSSRCSAVVSQFLGHWAQEKYKEYPQQCLWGGHQMSASDAIKRELSPPGAISELKYLRYLDLSFTGINTLPSSITGLLLLQVINLQGCKFRMLPTNMNSLINLCRLHASWDTISQISGIGKLTKLQELHEFRVKVEDGHRISELRDLNDIGGSLLISKFELVTDPAEALEANMVEKDYLTSLQLRWSDCLQEAPAPDPILAMGILEGLSPPRYLQELKLHGYTGFAFPDWVGQLKHVRVLEISSCERLQALPSLGQFENLQKLKLDRLFSIKNINFEAYGTSNVVFQSLEELNFERMEEWESWTYAGGREIFPNLQKLRIICCRKLRKLPFESLGSTTKEIFIGFCGLNYDTVSQYLQRLTGLARLEAYACQYYSGILIIPCRQLRSLQYLKIDGFHEVCIKGEFLDMRNLMDLLIKSCEKVTAELDKDLPLAEKHGSTERDLVMHSLTHLSLNSCSMQKVVFNILHKTPSLRTLHLEGIDDPSNINEMWLEQLTSLCELELRWSGLLSSSLASLSSLKRLTLNHCFRIHSIPPNVLPGNMKELQIKRCTLELVARCQNPNVEIWLPEEDEMDEWRREKLEEWHWNKINYGRMKLIEMQEKKKEQERLMNQRKEGFSNMEDPLRSTKESEVDEQLNKEDEEYLEKWLPQCVRDECPGERLERDPWLRKKLDEALISNEEGPSSLMKEREEWLKQEEHKLLRETLGKDWPNIAHVPYIRVNEHIVQNLYT